MRDGMTVGGFVVLAILGCFALIGWAFTHEKKTMDDKFTIACEDYTSFSVQGQRFKVKDVKSTESIPMMYSQDFYKIKMEDGTLITVGEYDIIWYK